MVMPSVRRSAPTRVQKGGPSKLRGVIWHKSNGKWEARIYEAGKQRFLGYFTSEVAAAKAYDARAVQLHESSAKVNFPMDHPHIWPQAAHASLQSDRSSQPFVRSSQRMLDQSNQHNHSLEATAVHQQSLPSRYDCKEQHNKDSGEEESCFSDGGASDEASLERAAVEVLASLSSMETAASWRSSSLVQTEAQRTGCLLWDEPADDDKPTTSTGTSPQPARRIFEWTHPDADAMHPGLWVRPNQEPAAPAESSCQLSGRSALMAQGQLEEEAVASKSPRDEPPDTTRTQRKLVFKDSNTSSSGEDSCNASEAETFNLPPSADACKRIKPQIDPPNAASGPSLKKSIKMTSSYKGVSWNIVCRKWVAVIWDRQTKRARHIGTFENDIDAARAYDREALAMVSQGATLNFPEEVYDIAPDTAPLVRSNQPKYQQQKPAVVPSFKWTECESEEPRTATPAKLQAKDAAGGKPTRGSSRFRGVSWCEKGQKWRALLWDGSRQHFLGHFKEEEEGARAYDRALLRRKKKDGCLNFPIADYLDIVDEQTTAKQGAGSASPPSAEEAPAASLVKPVSPREAYLEQPRHSQRSTNPPARFRGFRTASDEEETERNGHLDRFSGEQLEEAAPGEHPGALEAYAATLDAASLTRASNARGSSRFKGVSWSGRSGKWRAQMWHGAKVLHLGFFDNELDAARAYDDAVAQYRGPEAPSNFVAEGGRQASLPEALDGKAAMDSSRVASSFRGVRWHDRNCKWEARIFDGQRQVSLGYFDKELAAAIAYDAAAVQLRGPQTSTNFVAQSCIKPQPRALGRPVSWEEAQDEQPCPPLKRSSPCDDDFNPLKIEWGKKRRRN